jgi:DNA-binding NtrC family response regulator
MKTRCTNKRSTDYKNYGARGITFCEKWKTFDGFIEDMLPTYEENLTLDRIDNNGNYCKENCRWATRTEQANNTRKMERASRYDYQGRKYRVAELAEIAGIKRRTMSMRLREYGWSVEKALTT